MPPRAATCVLDHGVSGLQSTVLLRPRNHSVRHPVLHATGGVLPLEFHENVSTLGWYDLAKSNHRCVSNGVENVHGLISLYPLVPSTRAVYHARNRATQRPAACSYFTLVSCRHLLGVMSSPTLSSVPIQQTKHLRLASATTPSSVAVEAAD